LVLPDIGTGFYNTIGDGWISYFRRGPTLPPNCPSDSNDPGVVGFLRVTDSEFVDMPMPNLCESSVPDSIYMGTAISVTGDILSWNGSTWELTAQFHGGGHSSFTPPENFYGLLSGSAPDELYAWSWAAVGSGFHFDGAAWKRVAFSPVWVRPWGPRWAVGLNPGQNPAEEMFEFRDGAWQDRGRVPGSSTAGSPAIGSDGTDVFVGGHEWASYTLPLAVWIYRYVP
jgi:hypothetical protein